jgi:curved DNA-binding protein CbpA
LSEAHRRTPRLVPERRDAKSFPLSPTDGFVLSRVDGTMNEADLTASTGLHEAQVQESLAKLERFGLITFDGTNGGSSPSSINSNRTQVAPRASSVQMRTAPSPAPPVTMNASSIPESGSSQEVDLDPEHLKRVADVHREMEQRDYYWLLGVEARADKKAIKRAYYELAAVFHPDRYFRKRLGPFKVLMEAIFSRLTMAHDTLSVVEARSEYDAYLAEQQRSRAIEEHLAEGLTQAKEAAETIERTVRAQETGLSAPPPSASAGSLPIAVHPISSSPPISVDVNVATRRNTLARRLVGSSGSRVSSLPPEEAASATFRAAKPQPIPTAEAIDLLRRRYEERVRLVRAGEARKYARQADAAMAAGELVAAATAYRVAANLATDDPELERKALESRTQADVLLSDTYTRQAQYEEGREQWGDAARSWARVCKVRPDTASAHERAANAILKARGDMHDGVRFAKRACDIEPSNPFYRIALANCYAAAGLMLNARRELDTAAQLAPQDVTIQTIIRNVESRPEFARRD